MFRCGGAGSLRGPHYAPRCGQHTARPLAQDHCAGSNAPAAGVTYHHARDASSGCAKTRDQQGCQPVAGGREWHFARGRLSFSAAAVTAGSFGTATPGCLSSAARSRERKRETVISPCGISFLGTARMMCSSLWCIETVLRIAFLPIAAYGASEKPDKCP